MSVAFSRTLIAVVATLVGLLAGGVVAATAAEPHSSRPMGQPRQLRLPGVLAQHGDKRRFVLLQTYRVGGSRVLDTRTGRSVPVSQPCDAVPRGAIPGLFLVACNVDRSPMLSLVDARTGRVSGPLDPNPDDSLDGGDAGFGQYWIVGNTQHPFTTFFGWVYFNWRTGERRVYPKPLSSANLDSPDLRSGRSTRPPSPTRLTTRRIASSPVNGDTWVVSARHGRRRASWRIARVPNLEDAFATSPPGEGELRVTSTDYMVLIQVLDTVVGSVSTNLRLVYRTYAARWP
jgi:hypothetical protein